MKNIFSSRSNKKQFIFILVTILALLAITALLIAFSNQKQAQLALEAEKLRIAAEKASIASAIQKISNMGQTETSSSIVADNSALLIEQQEIGNAVLVNTLILAQPGFVGIYSDAEVLLNTSPWLASGAYSIVSIAMPEKLEADKTYSATIHFDTNDNKIFEPDTDIGLVDTEGENLMANFSVAEAEK